MWLRPQTANQKLKQRAQIQDADDMQVFLYVTYYTARGYNSTVTLLLGGQVAPIPSPLRFCYRSAFATCCSLERKLFDISRRSHPVKFFQELHTSLAIDIKQ